MFKLEYKKNLTDNKKNTVCLSCYIHHNEYKELKDIIKNIKMKIEDAELNIKDKNKYNRFLCCSL